MPGALRQHMAVRTDSMWILNAQVEIVPTTIIVATTIEVRKQGSRIGRPSGTENGVITNLPLTRPFLQQIGRKR